MAVQVEPILDADVPAVADFLHRELNQRVPAPAWADSIRVPWPVEQPNFGYQLLVDGAVAGAHLAFYSDRVIDGVVERFCNLGAWCVEPKYRFQGMKLLRSLLDQPGYHFTDLSPSGAVVPLNLRLKFSSLDTATALVLNLPWPTLPGRYRISADPATIAAALTGDALRVYRDHANARAVRHLVILSKGRASHVMFRKDRRKNLPLFASILHVSDPDLFGRAYRGVSRHLLLRHGIPAMLAEQRIVQCRPQPSVVLAAPRPKMFKSPHLKPDQIDYLYSELVCVAW